MELFFPLLKGDVDFLSLGSLCYFFPSVISIYEDLHHFISTATIVSRVIFTYSLYRCVIHMHMSQASSSDNMLSQKNRIGSS